MLVLGVDFTSAPCPRKPITVAVGRSVIASHGRVYQLDEIRGLESLDAFELFLRERGPWLGGFDLPFGQPRSLIEHERWPTDWPAFVRFYCGQPRDRLRDTFRRWCDARPAGDKFAWRKAGGLEPGDALGQSAGGLDDARRHRADARRRPRLPGPPP